MKLEKVDVILNSALEEQFRKTSDFFESKFKGRTEFGGSDLSKMQQRYLKNLLTRFFSLLHSILSSQHSPYSALTIRIQQEYGTQFQCKSYISVARSGEQEYR